MVWKQIFVIFGGICTAGTLTFFDLNFYCKALYDFLSVKGSI